MFAARQKMILIAIGLGIGLTLSAGIVSLTGILDWTRQGFFSHGKEALKVRRSPKTEALFMIDNDLSYRLKPDFRGIRYSTEDSPHQTNSLGLLGSREVDPDPAVRKIVFLGDSITYGIGVPLEEVFVSRMQSMAGPEVQLFNAGCPGWSTYQELKYYDKYLRRENWGLLVVVFSLNDLMKYEFVLHPEDGNVRSQSGELLAALSGVGEAARLGLIQKRFALRPETAPLAQHHGGFLAAWDSAYWRKYRAEVLDPLLPRRTGLPVVFVPIPTLYQLEAAVRKAPAGDVFFPQDQLARYCMEHGIPFIDIAPAFLSAADPGSFYFDDCHLRPGGHEHVSRYLWPRIAALMKNPQGASGSR